MYTDTGDELGVTGSRGQPRRAAIGQRRRRRPDITGRQDGDDSQLPLPVMQSISDVSDTSRDGDQLSRDQCGKLNPQTPLPAIHNQTNTCSPRTFTYL